MAIVDAGKAPFWNPDLPLEKRVADLVGRLTLDEKIAQMLYTAPAVDRLGIPAYNWWNECLHGVGRAGIATVFPQAIGLAASFDADLLGEVARITSDEARAKHHEFARRGDRSMYKGLTFWTPNINIFRDPRWGRGQETYGEDPYLSGRLGVAFTRGLQGDDPRYLKLVATPKHFAAHSGPEPLRHGFDARVSEKDMRETYLPHFKECVQEGGAWSVMGAYNRTNGEACCASATLLDRILRREWGFRGYVVSDCGAIEDIHEQHKLAADAAEAAALAVNMGCDLCCGRSYEALKEAVARGLIGEAAIDLSVGRLMEARFRLGMFDPPEQVAWACIPYDVVDCDEHRAFNRRAASQTMVLLKNAGGLLPLSRDIRTIAVIGPNADLRECLIGNYAGTPSRYVTLLDGIREKVGPGTKLLFSEGCTILGNPGRSARWGVTVDNRFSEAEAAAARADVVVMGMGLTPQYEGEEGAAPGSAAGGDRTHIDLPAVQQRLLERLTALGKPVVLVLFSGSPLSVGWAQQHVAAILQAWYPGGEGGLAIADLLFGDASPAGRLPVSVVHSLDQLPPFEDYSMVGRTYRFINDEPLYPFGFGLGYASFRYGRLRLSSDRLQAGEELTITATVENAGSRAADEVVQLYLSDLEASVRVPRWSLKGFRRVHLEPGEKTELCFRLPARQMALIDEQGRCLLEPGWFRVYVGGSQPDKRSRALGAAPVVQADFRLEGRAMEVEY
jgi:beta-glucosidase